MTRAAMCLLFVGLAVLASNAPSVLGRAKCPHIKVSDGDCPIQDPFDSTGWSSCSEQDPSPEFCGWPRPTREFFPNKEAVEPNSARTYVKDELNSDGSHSTIICYYAIECEYSQRMNRCEQTNLIVRRQRWSYTVNCPDSLP